MERRGWEWREQWKGKGRKGMRKWDLRREWGKIDGRREGIKNGKNIGLRMDRGNEIKDGQKRRKKGKEEIKEGKKRWD
jgi:hypothetical protein